MGQSLVEATFARVTEGSIRTPLRPIYLPEHVEGNPPYRGEL